MFKSLVADFRRSSENKKDSGYHHTDLPNNSDPPAYAENDKPEGKATTYVPQQHGTHVQICPHERLSFELFQRIQDLLRKEGDNRLDALSAMPKQHNDMGIVQSFEPRWSLDPSNFHSYQICRPNAPTREPPCVQGQAAYMSIQNGLELRSFWKIDFSHHHHNREAFRKIQDLLEPFHVWLCPHRRLHDGIVITKIVAMLDPSARDPDPVRRFEKDIELRQCQSCQSKFEFKMEGKTCSVKVTREIRGKTSEDASWLRQCSRTEDGK